MPRWLSERLRAQLKAQKLPYFDLKDGPVPMESRPQAQPHIELKSDDRTGDTFGPAAGRGPAEAQNLMLTTTAMEALIFGRCPKPAGVVDHDDQCRAIRDQLIVALAHIFDSYGIIRWRLQPGRFLTREEIDERRLQSWPGRIYRLAFSWDEGIQDRDFKGDGAHTVDGGDVTYETETETQGPGGSELPGASTEVL
jgi:hypothetical protein